MSRTLSLDIFDTCLTRCLDDPNDVFWLLEKELRKRFDEGIGELTRGDIYSARLRAQAIARIRNHGQDVALDQIWDVMEELLKIPNLAHHWHAELDVERRLLSPIFNRLTEAIEAKRRGDRVIYVSDTYFPAWFLVEQLRRHGFPIDAVYASSENGLRKDSGKLFEKVLYAEGKHTTAILHQGDHRLSDGRIPRRLGIKTRLVPLTMPRGSRPDLFENCYFPRLLESGLKSQQRKLQLLAGYADEPVETGPLMTELIGPVLTALTAWAFGAANRHGLKRLYFISRDARLAFVIGKVLSQSYPNIECRYLQISRQAVFLPSAKDVTSAEMPWLLRQFEKPVLDALLQKIELPWEIFSNGQSADKLFEHGGMLLKKTDQIRSLWNILSTPIVRNYIEERIVWRRSAALAYFKAEGLLDGVPWGMVDLGWHAHCQLALTKLLRFESKELRTFGFYIGIDLHRATQVGFGTVEALVERSQLLKGASGDECLFNNAVLWEHILGMADHPWVKGYRWEAERAVPEYGDPIVDKDHLNLFKRMERGIRAYAEFFKPHFHELENPAVAKAVILNCMTRALTDPSVEFVEPLRTRAATQDQASREKVLLVDPFSIPEIVRKMVPSRLADMYRISKPERLWRAGSVAVSSLPVRCMANIGVSAKRIIKKKLAAKFGPE